MRHVLRARSLVALLLASMLFACVGSPAKAAPDEAVEVSDALEVAADAPDFSDDDAPSEEEIEDWDLEEGCFEEGGGEGDDIEDLELEEAESAALDDDDAPR